MDPSLRPASHVALPRMLNYYLAKQMLTSVWGHTTYATKLGMHSEPAFVLNYNENDFYGPFPLRALGHIVSNPVRMARIFQTDKLRH